MQWVEFVKHLTMFSETVHFGQNFTIKCSKFYYFHIFLLLYFFSLIILPLLFFLILLLLYSLFYPYFFFFLYYYYYRSKIKENQKNATYSMNVVLCRVVLPTDHWVQCIVPRTSTTAPWPLSSSFCAEFIAFCAELRRSLHIVRWTSHVDHRF